MSCQFQAGKIRFFLSMFKGREDVFALRFHSKKTGKDGYSVACRNNGVYGVCDHRIHCSFCKNKAFYGIGEKEVERHLKGVQEDCSDVIGVYPIRKDNTVYFLAIDFDEASWKEDVNAVRKACQENRLVPGGRAFSFR